MANSSEHFVAHFVPKLVVKFFAAVVFSILRSRFQIICFVKVRAVEALKFGFANL